MQTKLTEYFNDKMSFILRPEYHIIPYKNQNIIAVCVPECPKDYMPCYFRPVGLPNGAYIREGNTSRKITDNEFRTYVATSKKFQFDRSEARGINKEDVSIQKIERLLDQSEAEVKRGASHETNEIVLENLGILGSFDGDYKPTVGGYLIFSKNDPQIRAPFDRFTVRCVRYSDSDPSSKIIDSVDIKGTLDVLIDESYKFVLKNISKKHLLLAQKENINMNIRKKPSANLLQMRSSIAIIKL